MPGETEKPCTVIVRAFDVLSAAVPCETSEDAADVYVRCICELESALVCIRKSEPNEKKIAIKAILGAMKRHPSSITVQTQAMVVLQHLAASCYGSTGKGDMVDDQADQDDMVSAVFSAMELFPHDKNLHWLGLDLLRLFQHSGSGCSDGWKNGTSVVLGTTERFADSENIRELALYLLAWLSGDETCRQVVIDHGGVVHIPSMMSKYSEDATLQGNGASILSWLVHVGGTNGRLPSLDRRFMRVFIQALSRHIDNPSVVVNIVCLLTGLGMSPIENDESYRVAIECMKRHTTTARVQECCLRFIRSRFIGMTTTPGTTIISRRVSAPSTRGRVVNTFLPLVLLCLRNHPDDTHIQTEACNLLTMITTDDTLLRECLSRDDAIVDLVLPALQRMQLNNPHQHHADSRIQNGAVNESIQRCLNLMALADNADSNRNDGDSSNDEADTVQISSE